MRWPRSFWPATGPPPPSPRSPAISPLLEGIGIQAHFHEGLTPLSLVVKLPDRYGAFKLPVQITKFDINSYNEALEADYTRDFMTAVFSHPSAMGFWEKRHWLPNGAFLSRKLERTARRRGLAPPGV